MADVHRRNSELTWPPSKEQWSALNDEIDRIYRELKKLQSQSGFVTAHDILSATHLDTTVETVADGDLLSVLAGKWHRLAKGNSADLLTIAGGVPTWAAAVAPLHNLLSVTHGDTTPAAPAKGALIAGSAAKWEKLPVGADTFVLVADSTQANGVKWVAAASAAGGDIKSDGTIPFAADESMGGHKLTNVTDPASAQDAATKNYVDQNLGDLSTQVYRGSNQTLTHNVEAALSFSAAQFDADTKWAIAPNPTRVTIQTGAKYQFVGQVKLGTGFAGTAHLRLYKNGVQIAEATHVGADLAAGNEYAQVAWFGSLAGTDYVELKVLLELAAGAGTFDVVGSDATATFLECFKGGGGGMFINSPSITSVFGSRAAAGSTGRIYLPSDGFQLERDNGSGYDPWGPVFPFTTPSDTGFAWVNQGSSALTVSKDSLFLRGAAAAAVTNVVARVKTAPATPYTITAYILGTALKSFLAYGLVFRESGSGKLHFFRVVGVNTSILLDSSKYTNPTTFSADYTSIISIQPVAWLRIQDTGVNRVLSYSVDGQNWMVLHTVGRTDFLTADQVGFAVDTQNGATPNMDSMATVLSWSQT